MGKIKTAIEEENKQELMSILENPDAAERALYYAIEFNKLQMIEEILKSKPEMLNATDSMNETPLIAAVLDNNFDALTFILSKNPRLDIQSFTWGTALTAAVFLERPDMLEAILEKVESFNTDKHPGAFLWAIKKNKKALVEEMCRKGADVNSISNKEYHEANNSYREFTLDNCTPFSLNPNYFAFDLPLNIAIKEQKHEIIDILIDFGAELDQEGFMEQTPRQLLEDPRRIEMKNRIDEKISAKLQQQFEYVSSETIHP